MKPETKDEVTTKCPECGKMINNDDLKNNLMVCPFCNYHFRISGKKRLELLVDEGSFEEVNGGLLSADPLNFFDTQSYKDKYEETRKKTGLNESMATGTAKINGTPVAIGVMDFKFMGGSMGSVLGEKVVRLIELAIEKKLPLIFCTTSGGARMQEGSIALMQMAKCSGAVKMLNEAKLLYISVLTDPTTGGVSASFGALGDVKITEPYTTIGFAGRRVVEQTMKTTVPKDFQTADFVFKNGNVDMIVNRKDLKETISQLLTLHLEPKKEGHGECIKGEVTPKTDLAPLEFEKPLYELEENIKKYKILAAKSKNPEELAKDIEVYEEKALQFREDLYVDLSPEQKVQMTRHPDRPTTLDFIEAICSEFVELHGDRQGCDDPAMVTGVGRLFNGMSVVFIGHQKGRTPEEHKKRNKGMPVPGGFRKAMRLMYHAERFGLPIITFLDTFGAYPGIEAEKENLAGTLALCLREMSCIKVPILTVVNEGGSGGAIAIGVANKVLMLENAYYSIIAPEGCAAILWKDSKRAPEAAKILKLTAPDLKELNIIDDTIKEAYGGAHRDPNVSFKDLKVKLEQYLPELTSLSRTKVVKERYQRFRRFGEFREE